MTQEKHVRNVLMSKYSNEGVAGKRREHITAWASYIFCFTFSENLILVKHNWLQYPIPLPAPTG
ncbi:hypothetical protein TSUD_300810 [Trifolium subterraneum]|uniref:Uncharacterized protein n=1 Tax=Trifolium subterraneum TaxID=3900 RepID=A0A2Z6NF40_TRISU|nr:hypothetical protein TSUD_300810 [Trifolium subterraneum]